MLTPKERDQIFIARLGVLLNEQGFSFKINKTGLSWKNEHVSVRVHTRGSRHSTEECSLRWVPITVTSFALRDAIKRGAPIRYSTSGNPDQFTHLEVREPDQPLSILIELTDHESCERTAAEIVPSFIAFWRDEVTSWLNPSATIDLLSTDLRPIIASDAPEVGSTELDRRIQSLIETRTCSNDTRLGEMLLATERYDDLRRLVRYIDARIATNDSLAKRTMPINHLIKWIDVSDK